MYIRGNLRKDVNKVFNIGSLLGVPQFVLIKPYEVLIFLIQMNIPMRRNQPAKKERSGTRVGCAVYACSFKFKMLRLHVVLSMDISVICIELLTQCGLLA